MSWVFVDDVLDAAQAFATHLGEGADDIQVSVMSPSDGRAQLLTGRVRPDGVLMDVELSSAAGEYGSGPGLAQDLRVKQKAREISEFPIVRFANRAPVEKNLVGDPASDDLFDLKIPKEDVGRALASVQRRLIGLGEIYTALSTHDGEEERLTRVLGIAPELQTRWSHQGFQDRMLASLGVPHVAAGIFTRHFLTASGLLIDEALLAIRLGVDARGSGAEWPTLLRLLPFAYEGVAANYFSRWWARGLEEWWFEVVRAEAPLASLTIEQRVAALRRVFAHIQLQPLVMPDGSAGNKPWRLCTLSFEEEPPRTIAVDPNEAIRLTPRADMPVWTDPPMASLRLALQQKRDFRLNRTDLARLERKHR